MLIMNIIITCILLCATSVYLSMIPSIDYSEFVLPASLALASMIPQPFEWEVTLFEHGEHNGRELNVGSNSRKCVSLEHAKLCTWGNGDDCIPASQSISSLKFLRPFRTGSGDCVKVYRDLHCEGMGEIFYYGHEYFGLSEGSNCCPLDNVIGSLSSCSYGECEYFKWPVDVLENYLHTMENRSTVNITQETILFQLKNLVYDTDFTFDDGYTGIGDSHRRTHHRDLRQVPVLPSSAKLRNGDIVHITYANIGSVPVQTKLFAILTPSMFNQNQCTRTNFHHGSTAFANRMSELEYVDGKDDRGHLIASCLGGPAELWNLLPQAVNVNRGNGNWGNWRTVENHIRNWLRQAACNFVEWNLEISYPTTTRRPKIFSLHVIYYMEVFNVLHRAGEETLICDNVPDDVECEFREY
jgi:hypothetical protein